MDQKIIKRNTYAVVEIPKGDGVTHTTKVAVPWIYLFKKKDSQEMFVKFLEQPLSSQDQSLLADFLSKPTVKAPESWPLFKCKVICTFGSHKDATNYLLHQMPPKQPPAVTNQTKTKVKSKQPITSSTTTPNGNSNQGMNDEDIDKFLNDLPPFDVTKATDSSDNELSPEVSPSQDLQSRDSDGMHAGIIDEAVKPSIDATGESSIEVVGGNDGDPVTARQTEHPIIPKDSMYVPEETTLENTTVDITSLFVSKTDVQEMLATVKFYFDEKVKGLADHVDTKFSGLESKLTSLNVKLTNLQQDIDEVKTWTMVNRPFGNNDNIMPLATLTEKHDLSLPLVELKNFDDFNAKLTLDSELYKDLKNHIICTVNTVKNEDFVEEITKLMKKLLSREVVIAHTAQRHSNHKTRIFKGTNFYICLKDALMHTYSGKMVIEDANLCQAIGSVINNAPDWDGFRSKRIKRA